jgi:hypothetical protein
MCIICVEIQKDKLTSLEARRNLSEVGPTIERDHAIEVLKLIWKKEDEERNEIEEPEDNIDNIDDWWVPIGGD